MKRIIALILASVLVCSFSIYAGAYDNKKTTYTIDTPYTYPILPGTSEWAMLDNNGMIAACHIPENILNSMTTEALIDTVMSFPLLVDITAYDSLQQGYEAVSQWFNGLPALAAREDASELIQKRLNVLKKSIDGNTVNNGEEIATNIFLNLFEKNCANNSIEAINTIIPESSSGNVYTPNYTAVSVTYNLTWADHDVYDQSYITWVEEKYAEDYPNSTLLRDPNPAYNCHSYAWYSQSSYNTAWMDDPSSYILDGSYTRTSNVQAGDKVLYGTAGNYPEHSGVVSSVSPNAIWVYSKWGYMGLYRHPANTCPYKSSSSFWERA